MLERTRRQLTAGYVGIVAAIVVLFGTVTLLGFRETTRRDRDHLLVEKATVLAEGSGGGADGADYGTVLLAPDGRTLERDRTAPTLGLPDRGGARQAAGRRDAVLRTVKGPDGDVRVASLATDDGRISQVARSLSADDAATTRLLGILGVTGVIALILAALGGLAMARRALRPVNSAFERQRAFIADASHELKTPLALIRLDADVLARDPAAPDAPELLDHQIGEIERMSALLSELMLLARLDAGRLAMERDVFNLGDVLTKSADRFQRRAALGDIELRTEVSGLVSARGDARRTGQLLAAVLDNAVRMTPGGGAINAVARRVDGRVEVEISDTGPGIPREQAERVFDRFHHTPHGRGHGSAGLGLAIARDLARAQGGDLLAEPGPNGGARLLLELPAGDPP